MNIMKVELAGLHGKKGEGSAQGKISGLCEGGSRGRAGVVGWIGRRG